MRTFLLKSFRFRVSILALILSVLAWVFWDSLMLNSWLKEIFVLVPYLVAIAYYGVHGGEEGVLWHVLLVLWTFVVCYALAWLVTKSGVYFVRNLKKLNS